MNFALWLKQAERGCDYTIDCGGALIVLKATNIEEAHAEARAAIYERTHISLDSAGEITGDSRVFTQAVLIVGGRDLSGLAEIIVREKKDDAQMAFKKARVEELQKALDKLKGNA